MLSESQTRESTVDNLGFGSNGHPQNGAPRQGPFGDDAHDYCDLLVDDNVAVPRALLSATFAPAPEGTIRIWNGLL